MSDKRVEVRRNEDGTPDEVLLYVDSECVAHLEQMNDDHWWLWFADGSDGTHVNFYTTKGNRRGARIQCRVEEDRPLAPGPAQEKTKT